MQPASFTDPPMSPDVPDNLPNKCPKCHGFLPGPAKWGIEDAWEIIEINGRDREVTVVVFTTACPKCGRVERVTIR